MTTCAVYDCEKSPRAGGRRYCREHTNLEAYPTDEEMRDIERTPPPRQDAADVARAAADKRAARNRRQREARRIRTEVYRSLGMVRNRDGSWE
jgi:hypothetical protein